MLCASCATLGFLVERFLLPIGQVRTSFEYCQNNMAMTPLSSSETLQSNFFSCVSSQTDPLSFFLFEVLACHAGFMG